MNASGVNGGIEPIETTIVFSLLCEFHDENGVICRQGDKHHKPDLDKNVAVEPLKITPIIAARMHIGTMMITASGSNQLLYIPASKN